MNIELGAPTAYPTNVSYRIGRVARYIYGGRWLDYGCADGGYTASLLDAGAVNVVGVDISPERIETARTTHPGVEFRVNNDGLLSFKDRAFDGAFLNEVIEHVADESRTLSDIGRVLKPDGILIIIAPNRGFPFEGHRIHMGQWTSAWPFPIVPWLPRRLTDNWVTARNYWPHEIVEIVKSNGFDIIESGFIMPTFEGFQWIPEKLAQMFRRHITTIDRNYSVKPCPPQAFSAGFRQR
jgi:2-polyprenyl-3-methyl-5-hydroxy-6-metoxy-1,4-benzoquinol methylase